VTRLVLIVLLGSKRENGGAVMNYVRQTWSEADLREVEKLLLVANDSRHRVLDIELGSLLSRSLIVSQEKMFGCG